MDVHVKLMRDMVGITTVAIKKQLTQDGDVGRIRGILWVFQ